MSKLLVFGGQLSFMWDRLIRLFWRTLGFKANVKSP